MKTYEFLDTKLFNQLYEKYFAMRIFHRTDEQGHLLIRFATKASEKELTQFEIIKNNLREITE